MAQQVCSYWILVCNGEVMLMPHHFVVLKHALYIGSHFIVDMSTNLLIFFEGSSLAWYGSLHLHGRVILPSFQVSRRRGANQRFSRTRGCYLVSFVLVDWSAGKVPKSPSVQQTIKQSPVRRSEETTKTRQGSNGQQSCRSCSQ